MFSTKFLNKLKKYATTNNIVIVVALIALVIGIRQLSVRKWNVNDPMSSLIPGHFEETSEEGQKSPEASMPLGRNEDFAAVDTLSSLPMDATDASTTNPDDLLPKDQNNEWAKLNPTGTGDLDNVNLLKAGYHCGVDTVSNSLRNANLQIRSEPPNPTSSVSPWLNSTIEPDVNRVSLELGKCS